MYISNFAFRKLRNKVLAFENTVRAAKEIPTSFMDGPQLKKTQKNQIGSETLKNSDQNSNQEKR